MRVSLNIIPDKPTVNNRIYPKGVLKKAIKKFNSECPKVNIEHGITTNKIMIMGESVPLEADVEILDYSFIHKLMESDAFGFTVSGTGKYKEGTNEVEEYNLESVYFGKIKE